jgi:Icc-related predicted phosphoesterase
VRDGYCVSVEATIRVAAAGDVHASEPLRERLQRAFSTIAEDCDLILLAGDLTTHGLPEQAAVLADACRSLTTPVVAVLGNHDHHSNLHAEVQSVLEDAGIVVLDRAHTILEIGELEVGVVGTKGFVGGFPGAEIADFGEPALRHVYQETTLEVDALESGLEAIAGCHKRIVLLHYAPVEDTLVGEPERIWAFLGSGRLAGPIGAHRPDLVVHGHAHHGTARGSIGEVPVHNVAVHVTGHDFAVFDA